MEVLRKKGNSKVKSFRILGDHWKGFTCIRDEETHSIIGAECHDCGGNFSKHTKEFLLNHKENRCPNRSEDAQVLNKQKKNDVSGDGGAISSNNNSKSPKRTADASFREEQQSDYLPSDENASPPKKDSCKKSHRSTDNPLQNMHQGQVVPIAQVSSNDNNEDVDELECSSVQRLNSLLTKLLLRFGIDFKYAKSVHILNIMKEVSPGYKIPAAPTLPKEMIEEALQYTINVYKKRKMSNIMYVQVEQVNGQFFMISAIIDEKNTYIPVDCSFIEDHSVEALGEFCENCVETVHQFYGITVNFIVTNNPEVPDPISYSKTQKYIFYINTFHKLIPELESATFSVNCRRMAEAQNYVSDVEKLKQKAPTFSMGMAVGVISSLRKVSGMIGDKTIDDVIRNSLLPIHVICMYLNPIFHSTLLNETDRDNMFEYFVTLLNDEVSVACVSDYQNKTSNFLPLFNSNTEIQPRRFWLKAMMYYKEFSSFALNLLNVPAFPKKINVEELLERMNRSSIDTNNHRQLQLAVMFEDLSPCEQDFLI